MRHASGPASLESTFRNRVCAVLMGAAALLGLAAPATADEAPAPALGEGLMTPARERPLRLVRAGRSEGLRSYHEPTRVSSGPRPLVREGWRLSTQLAPVFPTSDLGNSGDLLAASTGFGPRVNLGYEYLFGDLGVTPGFAFQFARFGMQYQDGSVLYFGFQPNVQASLHLGRIAPYASLGLGLDQFRLAGAIGDVIDALGGNVSANGLGLDLQFGANAILTRSVSIGVAWQIHPGFTRFKLADTDRTSGGMAFMTLLFGVSYLI